MSPRSNIGYENPDQSVTYIYCHNEGYIDCVGAMLKAHYTDRKKVMKLMRLGSISMLGREIGKKHEFQAFGGCGDDECTAYGRDRGESDTEATTTESVPGSKDSGFLDQEYVYLFGLDGVWRVSRGKGFRKF